MQNSSRSNTHPLLKVGRPGNNPTRKGLLNTFKPRAYFQKLFYNTENIDNKITLSYFAALPLLIIGYRELITFKKYL